MIWIYRIGLTLFLLIFFRISGAVLILVFVLFALLLIDRISLTLIESVILVHLISLIPFGMFIMLVIVSCLGLERKPQIGLNFLEAFKMSEFKFKLRKIMPCVYEVWSVDRYGNPDSPIGEVGRYSALCKFDRFFADSSLFLGVGDWQWVFYSLYYDIRVFDDPISAFRYARMPDTGA